MKDKLTVLLPYLFALVLDFYLLPFLMRDFGTALLLLFCVMPFIAFMTALVCGVRSGFSLWLPIAAFCLFFPTVFIHYNASAWVYAVVYAVIVLAGNGIGSLFHMKR